MNWNVLFFPCVVFIICFVAVWLKIRMDGKVTPLDFIASRGITQTGLSKRANGLVIVKDIVGDEIVDKTLLARSYCDTIKKDSVIVVVQYDDDKKIYMVEPYV